MKMEAFKYIKEQVSCKVWQCKYSATYVLYTANHSSLLLNSYKAQAISVSETLNSNSSHWKQLGMTWISILSKALDAMDKNFYLELQGDGCHWIHKNDQFVTLSH